MLVSFLIPTRGRVDQLLQSMKQSISTSIEPENIEFCIRVDDDDTSTLERIEEIKELHPNIQLIIGSRLTGYSSIHLMYNELAEIAKGTYFYLYNDDAFLETEGWDLIISEYKNRVCWIMTGDYSDELRANYQTSFPCFHRRIWEIWGRFSAHHHTDTYQALVIKLFDQLWKGFHKSMASIPTVEWDENRYILAVNCTNGGLNQEPEIIEINHECWAAKNLPSDWLEAQNLFGDIYSPIYEEIRVDAVKLLNYFITHRGIFKEESKC